MKYKALYNPLSGNGHGEELARQLTSVLNDDIVQFFDIRSIGDYPSFFDSFLDGEALILCGGDGTINRFVNDLPSLPDLPIYYYATGSGNDFLTDIGGKKGDRPVVINGYLENLPTVTVNGKEWKFLDNVGFGIDGYCCEEGDRQRAAGSQKINYAGIAIKGMLGSFKPRNAAVYVDGKEMNFTKVWLAPAMNGRYYGGGMIPTPDQKRGGDKLSVLVFHGSGIFKTLTIFPNIFKGTHVKAKKHCEVFEGKEIRVIFDKPTALQIDGETVLGVTEYTARK